MKTKKTQSPIIWVYRIFKKFIPQTVLMCFSSMAVSLLFIGLAFLSKNVLEIAAGTRQGDFSDYGIAFAVVIILQVALSGVSSLLKTAVAGKFTIALRRHLFNSLCTKKYSKLSRYHSGDILNRFTSDTEVIVSNFVTILPDICSMLTKIIGGAVALILLEWRVALVAIVSGLIIPAIGRLINKRYKHLHKECQSSEGETRSFLQECFENNVVIKTFKSEIPYKNRLEQYMGKNYRFKIKRGVISILSHLSLYSFFTIGYYAVLIWGASKISTGTLTFGTLIAFLQLISQLRAPLQNISGLLPKYYAISASAERLIELETLEDEPIDEPLDDGFEFTELCGNDITFSYGEKNILSNFSFKIQKGSITAFTGASGKGKSTLFKLILGLYEPQSGSITCGDIKASSRTRSLFAYVPQGNMILSGSIKDNLTMCNPDIPLSEVIKAAKTAEIHDYILSLENGYDSLLTERGGGLSEGQIQRLSIARALLADTPVLLLDEATSALDQDTELRVLANIRALRDKTVILVTHRKTSLEFCDNIISI